MSDQNDSNQEDNTDQEDGGNFRRKLEKQASQAKAEAEQLRQELESFKRQAAFKDAGLDPENKQHQYFIKGYSGDIDVDRIKAEASEAGFLGSTEADSATQENLAAHARMDAAAQGAEPVVAEGGDSAKLTKVLESGTRDEFYASLREAGWLDN